MLTPKKRTLLRVNNQMRIIMLHWPLRMLLIGDESTFVLTGNLNADKGRTLRNSTTLILFQKSMQCMQANIAIIKMCVGLYIYVTTNNEFITLPSQYTLQ